MIFKVILYHPCLHIINLFLGSKTLEDLLYVKDVYDTNLASLDIN